MLKKRASRIIKGLLAGVLTFSGITVVNVEDVKAVSAVEREESYTQYVDNFTCTQGDHGILFPGSVVPGGIVKLSPETNKRTRAGYDYSAEKIVGFSHTRIEGVGGGGAGGDVLITPTYMEYSKRPNKNSREQYFDKVDGKKVEDAHPGYYTAEMVPNTGKDDNYQSNHDMGNIKAEVTTDVRTGMHRYTFPKEGNVNLLLDMNYCTHGRRGASLDAVKNDDGTVELSGYFSSNNVLSGNYTMYYYMEVSKPVADIVTWENETAKLGDKVSLEGNDIGAVLSFDVEAGEEILVKVSISPISAEQAKIDMKNEVPHWNFDKVRTAADDSWNEKLGKVRIENTEISDPDNRLKKLFYTNLYHIFMTPVNATSTDGKWRGNDMKLYEADNYTHYDSWTFWDDYRKYAIIGLVDPGLYRNISKSVADLFETGYTDTGEGSHPVLTVRNENAATVLADAIKKGVTDVGNIEVAYEEAKKVADRRYRPALETGYVSGKLHDTAYYCLDAYAISVLAEALGKTEDAEKYAQMALTYKKQIREDAVTIDGEQFDVLWPKYADGSWRPCTPDKWQDANMYQGTLWQYNWYDSYDFAGLIELMGGKENAHKILSYTFGEQDPNNGYAMLHSNVNEVDVHLPYAFNFAGKPSKTQYWARQIYSKKSWNRYRGDGLFNPPVYDYVYKLDPEGFLTSMDDDAGTMSAMYVAAAMGLFPLTPGDTTYQIGSPFFDKMTLDLGNGKTFTIEAKNVSPDNFYIQSATLNGKTFNRSWLDYSEIIRGGTLCFEMGPNASKWAEDGLNGYSLSENVPTDLDGDDLVYSSTTFNETKANDGSIENTIQLKVKNNEFVGNVGDDLTTDGKIKVTNVPAGLTASATKIKADTVEIKLNGKASKHTFEDSISSLKIEVTEAATNSPVKSIRALRSDIKVMFTNDSLVYSTTTLKESAEDDGSIAETSTITLTGDSTFTGTDGEDFVSKGKVNVANVPAGLTAKITRKDAKTAILSFEGKALKHDEDKDITLEFTDTAFNGNTSTEINNANLAGLTPLIIDFYLNPRTKLQNKVNEAEAKDVTPYTGASVKEFKSALEAAKTVLANQDATNEELEAAYAKLVDAMDRLKINTVTDPTIIPSEDFVIEADNENLEGDYNPIKNAFDRDLSSIWHTQWKPEKKPLPATVTIDMKKSYEIDKWSYLPRPGGGNGTITEYELYGKLNEADEYALLTSGTWSDNGDLKEVRFDKTNVRYLKFVVKAGHGGFASAAEFYIHEYDIKSELKTTLALAKEYDSEKYTEASWKVLADAMVNARKVIADKEATITTIDAATKALKDAMDNLVILETGVVTTARLEGEKSDEWSAAGLKNESNGTSGNLGGTYDGAWIKYNNVDFKDSVTNRIKVTYATRVDKCALDARIEIRQGNKDGKLLGTIMLPLTNGWGDYQTVTAELDKAVTGVQDICFVLRGTMDSARVYVANIDYLEFEAVDMRTRIEFENRSDWSAGSLKTENSKTVNGEELTNIGGTYPNAWLKYDKVDFKNGALNQINVHYVNNSGRCKPDARLEFYLDSMEGTPFHTFKLPPTGNAWDVYKVATEELLTKVTGVHDVYVVMRGEQGGQPYIANLDWFEFDQVVLEDSVNKSELKAAIDACDALNEELFTPESWDALQKVLTEAKTVYGDAEATQEEVDAVFKKLSDAWNNLVAQADKEELQKAIDEAKKLVDDNYTEESWKDFTDALADAEKVLADKNATEEEVNKVVEDLTTAIKGLKYKDADYSKVDEAIAKAEALNKELYKDFSKVTAAIEAVVRDLNITEQTRVDAMATAINEAVKALEYKDADYSAVDEAIAKLPKDLSKYTEESVKVLNEAVDAVVRGLNITRQADVDAMAKAIEDALAGLVEWTEWKELEPSKPIVPTTPIEPSTPVDKEDKEEGTDTGDTSNAAGMAGLMLLAGAVVVSRRRKATK